MEDAVTEDTPPTFGLRIFALALVVTLVVLGFVLVIQALTLPAVTEAEKVDALATSRDECVTCHREKTPGIVHQYGTSSMAAAEVTCSNCHEVETGHPGAVEHEGSYVLSSPSAGRCQQCHEQEVAQFYQSRHSLPAYVAYAGSKDLSAQHMAMFEAIPEGSFAPDKSRSSLHELEGEAVTRFACEPCHDIGTPHEDGSVGQCQKCHLRHQFSIEQARKPETCNACHIGPDHPQWEIYEESPHGIAYATDGDNWDWHAEAGTLDVTDFPAATCSICHIGGFGASPTTHDVGDRLSWYLFAPVSQRRPDWETNMDRMKSICAQCHNQEFIQTFYADADKATEAVNAWVEESDRMMEPLKEAGLVSDAPFDEPIDFVYFELWHHWGRTTKFGAWMQGPDYTQWHGAYEVLSDLQELEEMVDSKLHAAGGVQ